jgi:hypothetical protein
MEEKKMFCEVYPGSKYCKALKSRVKTLSGCKVLLHLLVELKFFESSSLLYQSIFSL